MKYIHKEFSSNHSLKTKLIEGHTIYNIYLMIRRVLMVTILKDDEWYSFFSQNEIKSLFRNSRLFFEHLDDKNRLFKNTENGKIFVKIIIYTYFITIYEIMNCLYMNLDIFVKYENQFVVSDLEIQTVLRNILNCFYSHNLFTMSFVHDFNHPISFKDLNSDVMDWNKALKAVPIEVERRLMNIKKTVPCLDFMNRIALTSERDILLPLNFVDRIINSFLYSIQSKKNKILKK
ncbi:hypothetical protein NGRA_2719 [Nosema granulosis]|uniref:Uncharacterized protein n=1 Tax=Nosema granulosis TaxID=83296 RepID=A0A9P6GWW3_9MICR|nr:hypothetical protein NGRA_2719 [Nosema granulosis]